MQITFKKTSFIILIFIGFVVLLNYEGQSFELKDDFYKKEYEKVTSQPFPNTGVIIEKYAEYPDIHGDYEACALVSVSEQEYERLGRLIDTRFPEEYNNIAASFSTEWASQIGELSKINISKKEGGSVSKWGVVEGQLQIFILYYSW
jgi:hypothetical protein